jgi:phosphoribosyl 1,2-cyclic phosphodiesterase
MIRFTVLASGSKGNATIVESNNFRILIDCGLSLRELTTRMASCGLEPSKLDAILITHLHSDHVRGIPNLLQKFPLDIFVRKRMHDIGFKANWRKIQEFKEFELGPFKVMPIPLPHDDGGSVGYVISDGSYNLVYATDLGYPTEELAAVLKSADAAVIESNHDLRMLSECAYPDFIKNRIKSDYGHLSNCQSAELLATSLSPQCQHVVLAHLSERANHPVQALAQMRRSITNSVTVASQMVPTGWLSIENPALQIASVG